MLIEKLSALSGLSPSQIELIEGTASSRYFHFRVRKPNREWRDIYHPARELKFIQKWLNKSVLKNFDVSTAAAAYEKGSSISKNAEIHVGTRYTVRYDFQKFFPSFKRKDIRKFLEGDTQQTKLALDERDIEFFTNIVCRNDGLCIGAPSSPILTNRMMRDFDIEISRYCDEKNLRFSRYADDLFISSFQEGQLAETKQLVEEAVKSLVLPDLKLNVEKTAFLSMKRRRIVTGLVLTSDGKVSLGRTRKKLISAQVHHAILDKLDTYEVSRLSGMLAFCFDVERSFYDTLCHKYGQNNIERIRGLRSLSLKTETDEVNLD